MATKANITLTDEKLYSELSALRGTKSWNAFFRELVDAKKAQTNVTVTAALSRKKSNEKTDVTTLFMQIFEAAKKEFPTKRIPLSYFTTISEKRSNELGKEPNKKVTAGLLIGNDFGAIHLDVVKQLIETLNIDLYGHIKGVKI